MTAYVGRYDRPTLLIIVSARGLYRRRTLDEIDAKVVEHVNEYGFITNKTLQRLFDVNVYAARNMLTDLRERDLVKKIGKARGGPGVKYGPGKKFPKKRN